MATIADLGAFSPPVTPQAPQGNNTRQLLLSLLPILAALKSGGAAGAGGFSQGWTQGRTYLDEQKKRDEAIAARQEQAQYERQQAETAAQERKRKDAFDLLTSLGPHIGESVLSQMDQNPNLDPTVASGQEAQKYADLIGRLLPNYGIQAGDIQAMMPDVKTANSARVTKHAQEVLANLKGYKTSDLRAMGPKIPFMGRAVTYDELLKAAGSPEGLTPTSEQPKPNKPVFRVGADKKTFEQIGNIPADATMLQEPQPPHVSVNMSGMNALYSATDPAAIADGIRRGEMPPDISQYGRPVQGAIASALTKRGPNGEPPFNLRNAQNIWKSQIRLNATMNGGQQVRIDQSIQSGLKMYDIIDDLADKWDGKGLGPLSKANLALATQGAKGPEAAQLAIQLQGQIAQITSDVATLEQGGMTPTNEARDVAKKSLEAWWGKSTIHAMTAQGRANMNIRKMAREETQPITQGLTGGPDKAPANETPEQRIKRLLGGG